jgi:hypothetical protein
MDRHTFQALRDAQRVAQLRSLDDKAAWLAGYSACLRTLVEAYEDGLINDEWAQAVKDHLALEREFSS